MSGLPNPKSARSLEELYCLDPRFLSCLRSDFPDAFNWLNIEPEADVRMRRINAFKGSNSHKQLADYGLSAIAAPSAATSLKEKARYGQRSFGCAGLNRPK